MISCCLALIGERLGMEFFGHEVHVEMPSLIRCAVTAPTAPNFVPPISSASSYSF